MVTIKPNVLFPNFITKPTLTRDSETYIYINEVKKFVNRKRECWIYVGLLIISKTHKMEVFDYLKNMREEADYYDEIQFKEMRSLSRYSRRTLLGKKWLKLALLENNKRLIHFRILGLKLSKLQYWNAPRLTWT